MRVFILPLSALLAFPASAQTLGEIYGEGL